MPEATPQFSDVEIALRRAEQLDALDAILPFDRRDRLADILTDEDVATLKHLARAGMGANSLRALASDLAYLESWAQLATGRALVWPATEALVIKFVAHHLWDPAGRLADPAHGMPDEVSDALKLSGLLRSNGPPSPSTVRRRLSSWSTLTEWRGVKGPFSAPSVRQALRLAVRAAAAPRRLRIRRAAAIGSRRPAC